MPARRKSAAEWAELVAEFRQGNESDHEFCQRHGFVLGTFRRWLYRYGRTMAKGPPADRQPAFVKVARSVTSDSPPIVVRIGDGVALECPASLGVESIARLAMAVRDGR